MAYRTLTLSCPTCCSEEVEALIEVYGNHTKATRDSPEEWPEVYISNELECPNGCVWPATETILLEREALETAAEQAAEEADAWKDPSNYDYDEEC